MWGKMKEIYLFTNSEGGADMVNLGLIDLFIHLLCQYWEPPGLPFPLTVV